MNGRRHGMGILRDITERKRTEELLRAREARWSALTDNFEGIVQILGTDGTIEFMSRVYPPHTMEDVVGKSGIAERFPDFHDNPEAMEALNEQLLRASRDWANTQLDTTFHDHFQILDSINQTFYAMEGEARDQITDGQTPANLEDVLTLFLEIIDTRLNVEE